MAKNPRVRRGARREVYPDCASLSRENPSPLSADPGNIDTFAKDMQDVGMGICRMPDGSKSKWGYYTKPDFKAPDVARESTQVETKDERTPEAPKALPAGPSAEEPGAFDLLLGFLDENLGEVLAGVGGGMVATAAGLYAAKRIRAAREFAIYDDMPPPLADDPLPPRAEEPELSKQEAAPVEERPSLTPKELKRIKPEPAKPAVPRSRPSDAPKPKPGPLPKPKPMARPVAAPSRSVLEESLRIDLAELPPPDVELELSGERSASREVEIDLADPEFEAKECREGEKPKPDAVSDYEFENRKTVMMKAVTVAPKKGKGPIARVADFFRGLFGSIRAKVETKKGRPKIPRPPKRIRLGENVERALGYSLGRLHGFLPFKDLRKRLDASVNRYAQLQLMTERIDVFTERGIRESRWGKRRMHDVAREGQIAQGPYRYVWRRGPLVDIVKSLIKLDASPERERYLDEHGRMLPEVIDSVVLANSGMPEEVRLAHRMSLMERFAKLGSRRLLETASSLLAEWRRTPSDLRIAPVLDMLAEKGFVEREIISFDVIRDTMKAEPNYDSGFVLFDGIKHLIKYDIVQSDAAAADSPTESWLVSEARFAAKEEAAWRQAAPMLKRSDAAVHSVHKELCRSQWFRVMDGPQRYEIASKLAPILHSRAFRGNRTYVNSIGYVTKAGLEHAYEKAGIVAPYDSVKTRLMLPSAESLVAGKARVRQMRQRLSRDKARTSRASDAVDRSRDAVERSKERISRRKARTAKLK